MIQPLLFDLPKPALHRDVVVYECDAGAFLTEANDAIADFQVWDPPWVYANDSRQSSAATHYELLDMAGIVGHLELSYRVSKPDTYLALWSTYPTQLQFLMAVVANGLRHLADRHASSHGKPLMVADLGERDLLAAVTAGLGGWEYVSGGSWTKWLGAKPLEPGVGAHWRGDCEPLMLFRKGKPKPLKMLRNAFVSPRSPTHSEKPVGWLEQVLEAFCPVGGLALEVYAGTAPAARAAAVTGRRCVSIELDAERADLARMKLDPFVPRSP